ncbi:CBS domain-containing protein [Kutzneria sp. CA-103260]|uniref:CBS domain-containing protein n=1 Tax=Kutzneria sp. CA-103260 TaxID=2802641 RepID=UPI001BA6F527|nr:CBS domain-containing protein [Kutzneria sp. CA-103260]QUQ64039.1 CBS domain-containing protein [Kutzneria sp. CA-103260]
MRAQDVMSSPVVTARPDQSVKEIATLLAERGFTSMPVVDDDHVVGMVTEADVLRDRIPVDARTRIWRDENVQTHPAPTVAEVMSTPAVAVTPGVDCAVLARMMLDDHVRAVPVVDGGRGVVGIVTRRDLLRAIATDDATVLIAVRSRLAAYGGADRWSVTVHDGVVEIVDDFDDATDRHVAQVIAESVAGAAEVRVRSRESVR